MPHKEIIAVCSQSHKRKGKCEQNVECLNAKLPSTCSND